MQDASKELALDETDFVQLQKRIFTMLERMVLQEIDPRPSTPKLFAHFQPGAPAEQPSVEEACRYLHTFARIDDEDSKYVTEFYTRLSARWAQCDPRQLVAEMVKQGYAAFGRIGSGASARGRLSLLTDPPRVLPKVRAVSPRRLSRIRPTGGERVPHGRVAVCVTQLEYRLIRALDQVTEPQPSCGWNQALLHPAEMLSKEALQKRLQVPTSLIDEVLLRARVARIIDQRPEGFHFAVNPQDIKLKQIVSRPVYVVSSRTLERVEQAAEFTRKVAANADGMVTDFTDLVELLSEEWQQTRRSVYGRLTAKLSLVRTARSPFELLISREREVYPVHHQALGWADLVADDAMRGARSKRLTELSQGYISFYERVLERYEALLANM